MELKPCPFCGSTNLQGPTVGSTDYIKCNDCWTYGPKPLVPIPMGTQWEIRLMHFEDAWNRRANEET